jgi:hypothetical protein
VVEAKPDSRVDDLRLAEVRCGGPFRLVLRGANPHGEREERERERERIWWAHAHGGVDGGAQPWAELATFAKSICLAELDAVTRKHVPWGVLLLQAAQQWRDAHGGKLPGTAAERKQMKEQVREREREKECKCGVPAALACLYRSLSCTNPRPCMTYPLESEESSGASGVSAARVGCVTAAATARPTSRPAHVRVAIESSQARRSAERKSEQRRAAMSEALERSRKYDRQIRIWGDHGQAALEKSNVRTRPLPNHRERAGLERSGGSHGRTVDTVHTRRTAGGAMLTSHSSVPPARLVTPWAVAGAVTDSVASGAHRTLL